MPQTRTVRKSLLELGVLKTSIWEIGREGKTHDSLLHMADEWKQKICVRTYEVLSLKRLSGRRGHHTKAPKLDLTPELTVTHFSF